MGVPILKRMHFPQPRSWSGRTRICTTYTVSSRANNYRISMEKDTDTRTDCIRGLGYCIHSLFFYRIDGILLEPGRSLRYLGTVFGGLRSGCLALVGIWGYVKLGYIYLYLNVNPLEVCCVPRNTALILLSIVISNSFCIYSLALNW